MIGFSSAGNVGCLNKYCCEAALYFVKGKYDYMVYFAMISAFLGLANYSTLIAFLTFAQNFTIKRLKHNFQEKVIFVIFTLISIAGLIFVIVGPTGPNFMPAL